MLLSRVQITAALAALLVLVVLAALLLRPQPTTTPGACTHFASPTGTGSACTESSPCAPATWITSPTLATPGRVLCLLDGLYRGSASMLALGESLHGTPEAPITVRARTDGQVTIDGEFRQRPLDCQARDWTVEGLDVKDGHDTVAVLRGTRCTFRRLVAYSTDADLSHHVDNLIDIGGAYNLCEDCAAFGYARKGLAAGARAGVGPNTFRRVWVESNGFAPTATSGHPTNPVEIGYDQDNVTGENVIAHRDILASASEPEAPFTIFSTRGSALLGSLAYLKGGERFEPGLLLYVFPEGGSHIGSGHQTSQTLLKDLAFVAHPSFTHVAGFYIQGGSGSSGNVAENLVGVAPLASGCSGSGWTCTGVKTGRTMAEAIGEGQSVWQAVPGICTRYQNRVLTTEPLWSAGGTWPMEGRIDAAMVAAGREPVRLTQTIEQLFGSIPQACKTGSTPIPPDPTPPGGALTCTGSIQAVPGAVALQCQPTTQRR